MKNAGGLRPDFGTARHLFREVGQVRVKWESLEGRRVRLWVLPPQAGVWHDAATHPPLLLLHGLGCSVEAWRPTLLHLARSGLDRPVYAVDMPGSGRSQGPLRALDVPELAEWVVRLMDLLGIPRAHLIGNSLGCQVALALARQHPGRAASLILGGAVTGGDIVPFWAMALGLVRDGLAEPGLYDGSIPRMYWQTGPRRYLSTVAKMRKDHPVREAGTVSTPCLVVRGSRDTAVPDAAAGLLAEALPHSAYCAIEGSPHAVQYAAPEAFTDLAVTFLERVEAEENTTRAPSSAVTDTASRVASPFMGVARRAGRVWVDGRPAHYEGLWYESPRSGPSSAPPADSTVLLPLPPILLLHGLAGSGEVWERFLPLLHDRLRGSAAPRAVLVPDLPGCGRSHGPRCTLSMDDTADWCARFLDALGVERVDLGAHSMGCQVALRFAVRHPQRVGKMLLVGPTTGGRSVPLWRYLAGMAVGSSREPLVYRLLAARMFLRMGVRRYVETVREMMRDDVIGGADEIAASCLVVRGDRDAIIPESAAQSLAAALPGATYRPVGKAAHVVPFNSASELAALALKFWGPR